MAVQMVFVRLVMGVRVMVVIGMVVGHHLRPLKEVDQRLPSRASS